MSAIDIHRLTSNPLERLVVLRPVARIRYIAERCRGLRVLDLGAYDETEVDKPQHASWRWLHGAIAETAVEVLGVDASPKLAEKKEIQTRYGTRIVYGRVEDLGTILRSFRPGLIVAGELIEHTSDTLGWLKPIGGVIPGVRLLASTPNATSIINIGLAFLNRENAHVDHLQVYSYKTLACLARRLGMTDVTIRPYYYHSELFRAKVPWIAVPLVYVIDYFVLTPIQFLFPLTAGGLILEGVLGSIGSVSPTPD
jgi:hypothetical protein